MVHRAGQYVLFDEPNGDAFYIVDHSASPPTWYHLDGRVYMHRDATCAPRSAVEIFQIARANDWTPEHLYARIPKNLEYSPPA